MQGAAQDQQQQQLQQEQQRVFRQRLKQHHRSRLQHVLGFCDDNAVRMQQVEEAFRYLTPSLCKPLLQLFQV
jgi:superfamily II DNA helicase RecQ